MTDRTAQRQPALRTLTFREVERFALDALDQYGLTEKGWTFAWDRAIKRFGCCKYVPKQITLSRELTRRNLSHNPDQILDTVLHEVAHALAGHGAGHGPKWKQKCREVGAKPERCYSSSEVESVPPLWLGTCPDCGSQYKRQRLQGSVSRSWCTDCKTSIPKTADGTPDFSSIIVWEKQR